MEFRSARYPAISQDRTAREQSFTRWLVPRRRFNASQPELIDRPDLDKESLRLELEALEQANRRLGGHQLMVDYAERVVRGASLQSISVLDLGTGVGDIPRALVSWARAQGLPISVRAVDGSSRVLEFARTSCRDWPEISLERHDLLSLPYGANGFDVVLCSLALHHFDREDAVRILRRIQEIAKIAFIINDLRRNWFSILATPVLAGAVMRHAIVRQDALASCRAAFSLREMRSMAGEAGLVNCSLKRHHLGFRMVLQGSK